MQKLNLISCCCYSVTKLCLTFGTPKTAACEASLSVTISLSLLKLMSTDQGCYPMIKSSVVPFSCPQSFPAWGSFPMSRLFTSGSQSIGDSASTSVLPMNIQDWFPLGWTSLISLQSKRLSRIFSSTTVLKHQFFSHQPSFMDQLSHPYMTARKTIALTIQTFVSKVISLLFNMLCFS